MEEVEVKVDVEERREGYGRRGRGLGWDRGRGQLSIIAPADDSGPEEEDEATNDEDQLENLQLFIDGEDDEDEPQYNIRQFSNLCTFKLMQSTMLNIATVIRATSSVWDAVFHDILRRGVL